MKKGLPSLAAAFLFLFSAAFPDSSIGGEKGGSLLDDLLRRHSRDRIGVMVQDAVSGETMASLNRDMSLKPASVQKVLVGALSLKQLGPEFTFETLFWGDLRRDGTVPLLAVEGGGDPDLTIEKLWLIVRALKEKGVRRVSGFRFDTTRSPDPKPQTGADAYEGPSGALSVNFNAVEVRICGGKIAGVDPLEIRLQELFSGPLAMPTLRTERCEKIYRSVPDGALYFGKLFVALMKTAGIDTGAPVSYGRVQEGMPLLLRHGSKPLRHIVDDMNHFSTNFIAEQLLAMLGRGDDGLLKRERGRAVLRAWLNSLGFSDDSFRIVDGSGLSHDNRLNARLLVSVLRQVFDDPEIKNEFQASLSVAGASGTLKERKTPVFFRGKTGTIDGVKSLAGFATSPNGRIFALAAIQNDVDNTDRALEFERVLLEALSRL